jgi:hypothetical protein
MQTPQPDSPPAKSKLPLVIITIVVVLLIVCVLIACCVLVVPALLGPSVGNVFSNIIENMPTPTP